MTIDCLLLGPVRHLDRNGDRTQLLPPPALEVALVPSAILRARLLGRCSGVTLARSCPVTGIVLSPFSWPAGPPMLEEMSQERCSRCGRFKVADGIARCGPCRAGDAKEAESATPGSRHQDAARDRWLLLVPLAAALTLVLAATFGLRRLARSS